MVSGPDVHVALEAGLWKALVGSGDRVAMRTTCKDAMTMADMLHDTAVLPVGPDTLGAAASVAAYHRRLGTVRALHVRYSASDAEEPHAVHFMEAYSAALGPALPASHCSIEVPAGVQLPVPSAAVLLQRVVPHVERLDMALGSYDNAAQVLQALEPCTRLRALRLLPAPSQQVPAGGQHRAGGFIYMEISQKTGVLDALCNLTHLHTLSGPWRIDHEKLKRLCDALPSLTTLGFKQLSLPDPPCACISRQLHTLAACDDAAGAACIDGISAIATALPAVEQLKGVTLESHFGNSMEDDMLVVWDAVERFAACAHDWTLRVWPGYTTWVYSVQQVAQGLPAGCLAPLQHLELDTSLDGNALYPGEVADMLGCLLSAAPSLATVTLEVYPNFVGWNFVAMAAPLRQAARLHTLRIVAHGGRRSEQQAAALLEGVVRCLTQPGAEGEAAPCRALQDVLLEFA